MKLKYTFHLLILSLSGLLLAGAASHAEGKRTATFHEDFTDLTDWEPLTFDKVPVHSVYSIEKDKEDSFLKLTSKGGASALVSKRVFQIKDTPIVSWRWKVATFPPLANPMEKSGDDYAIRVYLIFKYEPEEASFFEGLRYGSYKTLYGKYPPHSSLNYVWSLTTPPEITFKSPYTDQARMKVLAVGEGKGLWQEEKVNALADYVEIFGEQPPAEFQLGIMTDSDNTEGITESYLDYVRVESQ